jgi:hypothetical protein
VGFKLNGKDLTQTYQYDILMLLCITHRSCNELVEEFGKGRSNPLNWFEDKYKEVQGLAQINVGSDPVKRFPIRILLKDGTTSYFQENKNKKQKKTTLIFGSNVWRKT